MPGFTLAVLQLKRASCASCRAVNVNSLDACRKAPLGYLAGTAMPGVQQVIDGSRDRQESGGRLQVLQGQASNYRRRAVSSPWSIREVSSTTTILASRLPEIVAFF